MPYKNKKALPEGMRNHLPRHAQDIYKEAHDSAYLEYKDPGKRRGRESQEAVAHKVAWSAVKKKYRKGSGAKWQEK